MEPTILSDLSNQLADAVERAGQSLVTVRGRPRQAASGVVYAPELVLTANHVLERDEDITVHHRDVSLPANIAGRDQGSDLAVLRVPGLQLTPAGRAQGPARVGQLAVALGRGQSREPAASLGIVSFIGGPLRTGRGVSLEQYIRTDATPYPGFSGGPLIDVTGGILGITTTGFSQVALAIPHSLAWPVAEGLAQRGTPKRGFIGISSQPVRLPANIKGERTQEMGLLVLQVEENSPAARANLLLGDVLVSFDGQPIADTDDLLRLLTGDRAGRMVPLEVIRGGNLQQLEITIGLRD